MSTRLLALTVTLLAVMLLFVAVSTAATLLPASTITPTTIAALTDEVTVEVTETPTAEATDSPLVGDPVRGEDIFRHGAYDAPPCATCHSVTVAGRGGAFAIGPGLKGISERGATRIEGMSAADYIEDSIRHPTSFLVPGFNPIMPIVFGQQYADQDIADLVAFLMTV